MENIVDYKNDDDDDDEIIDTDIFFDTLLSYNINSEIMKKVEELLEDKNKKIIN